MLEKRKRGVSATDEGLKRLLDAKAAQRGDDEKPLTYSRIAEKANIQSKTVERFFQGKAVDGDSARVIVTALGLDIEKVVDPNERNPPVSIPETSINWHEVCSTMLEPQRRITSNVIMQDKSAKKERKQIYVPLALVQRTKIDKREKEDFSPDAGTRLYEPEYKTQQRFEHEAFLSKILEPDEDKTKVRQIAVIGEPGAGKTTLLQAIAFWVLEKDLGLPIWISLADLGRNGTLTDIQTYIFDSWLEQAIPSTNLTQEVRDNFTNQIQQGRVWLLLDGVDEISGGSASYQPLEEISRQLTGWVGHSSRVVLTCRLNVWQADYNALETFETYRLLDFDYPQQVHQFIDNWFVKEIKKGERLKTQLDSAERVRLRDLVQTPLRLVLLCDIWQDKEGNLPETKAGLYHQYVQKFYNWKQNRFRTNIQEQRDLNQALGRLALRDINEGGSRFRLRETFITKELGYPDDETSLFYKTLQLGWLNHVGIAAESPNKEEKVYAFYHAIFEEYFAALAVDEWRYFLKHVPENPEQGTYRIFEPQWKEVILLWLGLEWLELEDIKKQQKEEFIKALVEFEDGCKSQSQIPDWKGFYEYRAYFLAAAGIAEFKDSALAEAVVKQIVTWGFGYFNIQTQDWQRFDQQIEKNAKAFLVETDRQKATTALEELIKNSQSKQIYCQAAYNLGKIAKDNPIAITALEELIENSQSEETRRKAAHSLGEVAKDNLIAITALVKLIENSQSEETRREAAYNLGKIAKDNPIAITALVKLMENSQSEETRSEVVHSLSKIAKDNSTAITALVELIKNSQSEKTYIHVILTLGTIAKDNSTAITALKELIGNSQSEEILWQAASILGMISQNNPTAITTLEKLTGNSQSEQIRWQAAYRLGKIAKDNPTAITALVELIKTSQSQEIMNKAAYSLGEIAKDNPTALTAIQKLFFDLRSELIDSEAVYSSWEIVIDNLITALEELFRDVQTEETRRKVAYKILKKEPITITALVDLIGDPKAGFIFIQVAYLLREIAKDNPIAITALEELIRNSQSEEICWQAAYSLGIIAKDNPTAITTLLELMRNSQLEEIRMVAAYSLKEIAKDNLTVITVLVKLIENSQSEQIRMAAADILEVIAKDNPTAITALLKLIENSQSQEIRWQAADILEEIAKNNPIAITTLVELIKNSQSEQIRWQAASSLQNLLTASENMTAVVTALKNHLSDETYEVIWHCTQTMTYPAFYQAWHQG